MKKVRHFVRMMLVLGIIQVMFSRTSIAAGNLENFRKDKKPAPMFADVACDDWFYPYVQTVAEKGLMVGTAVTTFNPLGNVTLAETITIASRLHSIYYTGGENFRQGPVWYQVYLDYAKDVGISYPDVTDYSRQATRAQFAQIIASAFPTEALAEINDIPDGEVPDVSAGMAWSEAVYTLYRAGVLTGNDADGTFAPYSNILRSEVAAIISRMVDPETRVFFDLAEKEELQEGKEEPEQDAEREMEGDKESERDETDYENGGITEEPIITEPTFCVQSVEAEAGQEQVAVTILVKNNPGISALALNLSYDSGIALTDIVYNDQLSGETMPPQTMKNPVKLIWINPFENVEEDFVLATAYFDVSSTASRGNHQISVTYSPDDVYALSEENVHFEIIQGVISVTK